MTHLSEGLTNETALESVLYIFPNCTDLHIDYLMKEYYLPAMYSVTFLVGFPGNAFAIFVYLFKMRPWRNSTVIMFNLAITDMSYLASLPFLVYYNANEEHWSLGDFMCKLVRFVFHLNLYGSILLLTCFSIFRYVVIVHPMKFHSIHKRKWAVVACSAVWIVALMTVIPMSFMFTSTEVQGSSACLDFTSSSKLDRVRWYNWLLTVLGFFLPLLVVTLCYTSIIYSLANGPYTRDSYKRRARTLVATLLVVFYVCFLPFHILRGIWIEMRVHPVSCYFEKQIQAIYIIFRPIAALNTFANLVLYTVIGDNFQQAAFSVLRYRQTNNVPYVGNNIEAIYRS
ncbi:2-oxoglutarate receptor 1-like [Rhinatrema bivittatum]|uniref:2-oxoglutarate receptor 1-like n=1 Tax=Rhinatrema bivittatum TaxID=194408 RepID=UPI001125E4FB|nr:2-oxoglutarate receptor 1-like [Rhinatrema bivittatum]